MKDKYVRWTLIVAIMTLIVAIITLLVQWEDIPPPSQIFSNIFSGGEESSPTITASPMPTQTPVPMTDEARNIAMQAIEILDDYLNGIVDYWETSRKLRELPQFSCDSSISGRIDLMRIMILSVSEERYDEQRERVRARRNELAERLDYP